MLAFSQKFFKARMLKLGIHMDNELSCIAGLTIGLLALIFPFLSIFLSFRDKFSVTVFSGTVQARIFKYGIHM